MDAREIKISNNLRVLKMKNKLRAYELDNYKTERKEKNECMCCTYIDCDRIVMNAFTHSNCKECGHEMVFANSDIDKYCLDCAKKLNVCRHCGAEMD